MNKLYVQYGCGLSAPREWTNFDASPTLRVQKLPIIGKVFRNILNVNFPSGVIYGNIINGLPIAEDSCDGLYCSHVLEHLSLKDFRQALINSYKYLKKGGTFRCVVPDLEFVARRYIKDVTNGDKLASIKFISSTALGSIERKRGVLGFLSIFLGNTRHLWMWDKQSLSEELKAAGFSQIRVCAFNDSEDKMFKHVEDGSRFAYAVAIECKK